MKIAILTLGTRGDVQPYAVLGRALQRRGHDVVLSTAKNFKAFVESYGLKFVPVEADFQAILNSDEGKKIRKNPFLARKQLSRIVYPMMADAFVTFYTLAKDSDRILFHVKTMADNFSDQFPEKMIKADVIPATQPTNEFPNPIFSLLPIPRNWNRFTFKITEWGLRMWAKPVTDFRRAVGLPQQFEKPDLLSIYGISEVFLKRPVDYPKNSHFSGFWSDKSNTDLSQDVLEFIAAGEPPLLITFGSMPFDSKLNLSDLIKTIIFQLKTRIVLVKGWGLMNTSELEDMPAVKVIDAAPYDKLIPLVRAVVHHGGIGTITYCLQAGKPFLTCAVLYPLGDQYFWGMIAYKKGVSLKPLPLKKATAKALLRKIEILLNNKELYVNAKQLSIQFENEDGVANAIKLIEGTNR